jgi:RNA polymerase sigma-70 factor (ECF subfamily)
VAFARLDTAARLILRDMELARDALQEAMVRAWRDLPGLRDPDRFDAWLHRLTVNACLDAARHRRRRVIEVELTSTVDIPVPDGSVSRADHDELDAALRDLEPDLRAIVVLHYYLELTLPETAHALGVPVGTVKSRLHRALAALRLSVSPVSATAVSPAATQGRYA